MVKGVESSLNSPLLLNKKINSNELAIYDLGGSHNTSGAEEHTHNFDPGPGKEQEERKGSVELSLGYTLLFLSLPALVH